MDIKVLIGPTDEILNRSIWLSNFPYSNTKSFSLSTMFETPESAHEEKNTEQKHVEKNKRYNGNFLFIITKRIKISVCRVNYFKPHAGRGALQRAKNASFHNANDRETPGMQLFSGAGAAIFKR